MPEFKRLADFLISAPEGINKFVNLAPSYLLGKDLVYAMPSPIITKIKDFLMNWIANLSLCHTWEYEFVTNY